MPAQPLILDHEPRGVRQRAWVHIQATTAAAHFGSQACVSAATRDAAAGRAAAVGRTHPRFTMISAEFRDRSWGISAGSRGLRDAMSNLPAPFCRVVGGRGCRGHRLPEITGSAGVLFHHEAFGAPIRLTRSSLSWVLSADRRFSRERYAVRCFGVANTSEGAGFARVIATGELGDNLALEGSIGWFVGEGRDLIGRFADSDFIYVRLKRYF